MTALLHKTLLALLVLLSLPLRAHDLWIAPSTFRPEPGQGVALRLQVGEKLSGEPLPLVPQRVKRFFAHDGLAERPVAARRGGDPAGQWRAGAPGLHVISYQSHASRIELDAQKFNAYLAEEGLEAVLRLRAQRGHTAAPASERFARCAKSLLQVGPAAEGQRDIDLGCTLELVAEGNPYAGAADLPWRLRYLGQPLAGALVVALNAQTPAQAISARTDAEGRVRLTLAARGLWLVKAVHMLPAEPGADAEWQSHWASVTFER
ncbi:DUF4198 domain-containing protein [Aquabacterium sp.]|uniref:DUF4198 domain-containing protein n=1 Tax=Aquabacterium sp. TaxID=1872578 RepID=UPI002CBCB517|nr:DUF4198 domain-containing protein [Aquabacterium sp.]HSW06186.1 DUF4198 domain-containing protein [Aquabacterium sp.]